MFFNLNVNAQSKQYKIHFVSVDDISNEILKLYSGFQGDSIAVLNKLSDLKNELHDQGYLSASIDSVLFNTNVVTAYVFQGKKYIIGEIDYSKIERVAIDKLGLHQKRKPNGNIYQLIDQKNKLVQYYENTGYPFVKAYFEPFEIKDSVFVAGLKVEKGNYYSIDSIHIKSDAKISLK